VPYHPCAHSSSASPLSVASILAKTPSYPSIHSNFTPLSRSTHSRDASGRAHNPETKKKRRRRPRPTSRVRARVYYSLALHVSIAHTYLHLTCSRANCTCILSYGSPRCTFRVSRVYSRTRLYRDPSSSGSLTRAKQQGQRPLHIALWVPSCRSQRTGYHRMFRLPWLGLDSHGRVSLPRL
jgi:hypothetical protein